MGHKQGVVLKAEVGDAWH